MPRKERKTVDLPKELHTQLKQKYEEIKDNLKMKGITTFSGWITTVLTEYLEES